MQKLTEKDESQTLELLMSSHLVSFYMKVIDLGQPTFTLKIVKIFTLVSEQFTDHFTQVES